MNVNLIESESNRKMRNEIIITYRQLGFGIKLHWHFSDILLLVVIYTDMIIKSFLMILVS